MYLELIKETYIKGNAILCVLSERDNLQKEMQITKKKEEYKLEVGIIHIL